VNDHLITSFIELILCLFEHASVFFKSPFYVGKSAS